MNKKAPITYALAEDKKTAEVTFAKRVNNLTAPDLDVLIATLGDLREQMKPAVSLDQTKVTWAHYADHCYFRKTIVDGKELPPKQAGALFLFQSPRFGWFQFPASAELCAGLSEWLQTGQVDPAMPTGLPLQ